jgi:hypothetical protein
VRRFGDHPASLGTEADRKPAARPRAAPASTSERKWTPRYTREKATAAAIPSAGHRRAGLRIATTVAAANACAACPEGNDDPCGRLTAAWIAWSATGGRARPTAALIAVVSGQVTSAANAA